MNMTFIVLKFMQTIVIVFRTSAQTIVGKLVTKCIIMQHRIIKRELFNLYADSTIVCLVSKLSDKTSAGEFQHRPLLTGKIPLW